jgi:2-polyprenyl-3-methyl-5-hydroxy-6-metoxy-1,4-benzoquinol methylase/spore coat polysaccharide biosynthesis predicted glycosyltransferase SpsG
MSGILVVPAFGSGRGGGHLVRSLALVRELRSLGKDGRLYIPSEKFSPLIRDLDPICIISQEEKLRRSWDRIILDQFKTSREELARWSALGPVIGIDEGGPGREGFDFLMDILPGLPNRSPANLAIPALIPLPQTRREEPFSPGPPPSPLKTLVSFGAEDPAGLTFPVCRALLEGRMNAEISLTAVSGSLAKKEARGPVPENLELLENVPDLKETLASYDLAITHFGLTAFEALHAGTPVLLLSPTAYHEKLARHAGFVSAGIGQKGVRRLKKYINNTGLEVIAARSAGVAKQYGLDKTPSRSLGGILAGFSPRFSAGCPVCGKGRRQDHPVLARFPDRTYRRCPNCGMVYMLRFTEPPIEYKEDYFFDAYRRQYGKTYLEDFPNLKQTGKIRLHRIRRLRDGQGQARLLDIGCAYGPFLAAAAEGGFSPLGIDPAEDAVRYVKERLKIPAITGFFPDPSRREFRGDGLFDVITLWYVIEHFENLAAVLGEINRLLKPKGLLAFSSPSLSGVSGRKSLNSFLKNSPGDHYTIWDPRGTGKILRSCGFTVEKIVITGHHPERFPLIGKFLNGKRGAAYGIADRISRFLGLGDTFEVYAVKN